MTKKLRRKFIAYAAISLAFLLFAILGSINIANFILVANQADGVTASLARNGGAFPDFGPGFNPGEFPGGVPGQGPGGIPDQPFAPDSPDLQSSVRYFTVSFPTADAPVLVASKMYNIEQETAFKWAKEAYASQKATGWKATYYRFRSYRYNNVDYVSFIDQSRELAPSYNVLNASIVGGLSGLAVSILLLLPLSKWMIKPTEEAWRKQKRFVSDASHELKTPLSIISANNELSELTYGENEQTKAIGKQVKTMNRLVKNLNALAKLEEGETLGKTDLDLSSIIAEISSGFAYKNKEGKTFETDIEENIHFQGEEAHIRTLYSTVLDNAFKYGLTSIKLSLHKEGDRIVTLIDNDAHLAEDGPLDRVFERFYRSDEARASEVEGSGIGLSLAKEIVLAHHGRIYAKAQSSHFLLKIEF